MTDMLDTFLLLLIPGGEAGFWSPYQAAQIGFFLSIIALVTAAFGWGKAWGKMGTLAEKVKEDMDAFHKNVDITLNGYGARLRLVEEGHERMEAREREIIASQERIIAAQAALQREIGAAAKSADACTDLTRDFALEVGVKIDGLRRDLALVDKNVGERLTAVETVLKERKVL